MNGELGLDLTTEQITSGARMAFSMGMEVVAECDAPGEAMIADLLLGRCPVRLAGVTGLLTRLERLPTLGERTGGLRLTVVFPLPGSPPASGPSN